MPDVCWQDGKWVPVLVNEGTVFDPEEGKTRQEESDQADLNKILARAQKTGIMPVATREGLYLDISDIPDYRTALDQVNRARDAFMKIDPRVRSEFENDPAKFLDAFQSVEGQEKLVKLGVLPEPESVVLERAEAAAEERAIARAEKRARDARIRAAESEVPKAK